MPRLAFPVSVRAVVGSLCRKGQVLGFSQNECKGGKVNPAPRFSLPDPENMKMPKTPAFAFPESARSVVGDVQKNEQHFSGINFHKI